MLYKTHEKKDSLFLYISDYSVFLSSFLMFHDSFFHNFFPVWRSSFSQFLRIYLEVTNYLFSFIWECLSFPLIFKIDLYLSIIASQYCVSFCCTRKWIRHIHTYIPISPPCWASLPPFLSHTSRSSQTRSWSPCAMLLLPTSYLFYIWQCIYVNATLTSPHLPPAPSMSSRPFSMSTSLFLSGH